MSKDDADLLFQLDQDPEVMRYLNGGTPSSKQDIAEVMLPRMQAYRDSEKGWGIWQVNLTESNEYLGWVLVRPMHFFSDHTEFDNLELGWRFFRASWGKGYASEAAQQILNAFSENKDYHFFSAIADEDNLGSIGVMKNIGMEYVKTYIHTDSILGELDVALYRVENK